MWKILRSVRVEVDLMYFFWQTCQLKIIAPNFCHLEAKKIKNSEKNKTFVTGNSFLLFEDLFILNLLKTIHQIMGDMKTLGTHFLN